MKTTENTIFANIFNAIKSEIEKQQTKTTKAINEAQNIDALNTWYFLELLPKGKKIKDFSDLKELQIYLIKRLEKRTAKKISAKLAHLQQIEAAPDFKYFNISVEWKVSKMWGANPRASGYDYFGSYESGSIGGCGYDKLSTAVANVLNQSSALLKALYLVREQNMGKTLNEVFGYGSGSGILPRFEGGVGVSCYPEIFKNIGFNFRQIASGKTFDAFEVK